MTPHALKMLTSFIFVVAVMNSIYYAIYLTYDPATRRLNYLKSLRSLSSTSSSRLRIPIVKVVWIRGPNHTRIRQTMKVYWVPEYACTGNTTETELSTLTMSTSPTDYRDPEDYSYTEYRKGAICPPVPLIIGPTDWKGGLDPIVMERVFALLERGGAYQPSECVTTHHVAVIVPYKGNRGPLLLFLFTLHLALLKQQIAYQVFVVREFDASQALNSGRFFNIGFLEAYKLKPNTNWTCFVFHDPYLAPTDSRNLYRCSKQPKQLFGGNYNDSSYKTKFGGIIAMRPEVFRTVNGFSNLYHDTDSIYHDMYDRLIAANYTIEKPSRYARYDSLRMMEASGASSPLSRSSDTPIPIMEMLTSTVAIEPEENGLSTLSYTVISDQKLTHTVLLVDITKNAVTSRLSTLTTESIRIPTHPSTSSTPTIEDYSMITTMTNTVKKTVSKPTRRLKIIKNYWNV